MPNDEHNYEVSEAEAARYIARRQIAPHEIEITAEERERQPSARKRYLQTHRVPWYYYLISFLMLAAAIILALFDRGIY